MGPGVLLGGAVNIRRLAALRALRTNFMIMLGFGLIVAGIWIATAYIWHPTIGMAAGLFTSGIAVLVMEGLSGEAPR